MEIAIKNMVCQRCVIAVEQILKKLNIKYSEVILGSIVYHERIDEDDIFAFESELQKIGFEILKDPNAIIVKKIKTLLVNFINNEFISSKISNYLTDTLRIPYQALSQLFSEMEGISIEKYFIHLKIEKAKELLSYDEMSLKEIAYKLNYSSTAHLSKQFKDIAGLSASSFKKINKQDRLPLDQI